MDGGSAYGKFCGSPQHSSRCGSSQKLRLAEGGSVRVLAEEVVFGGRLGTGARRGGGWRGELCMGDYRGGGRQKEALYGGSQGRWLEGGGSVRELAEAVAGGVRLGAGARRGGGWRREARYGSSRRRWLAEGGSVRELAEEGTGRWRLRMGALRRNSVRSLFEEVVGAGVL